MKIAINPVYGVAAAAVVAALLYVKINGAGSLGQDLGGAAVDVVNGAVTGAVKSTGELIGIPDTNMTECDKAKAEGRTWDASFACPAKDFIAYMWGAK